MEEVCEVTLPSTSVALQLILRSRKKKLIQMEECKALAAECGIELTELPAVLWLLQHFIGSIRHYPESPDLREYIVNSPQVLINAPTQLLAETFAFKKGDLHHVGKQEVWTRGVFTKTALRKLWKDEELTPDLLLSFLLHLNIVAPLQEEETFFMPCALVCAPESGSSDTRMSLRKDSALLCFRGGLTPKGVYSSLLAYLLNKKPQTKSFDLEWILPTAAGSLSSNRAKLSVVAHNKYPFHVELSMHLKFIEVAVNCVDHPKTISPTQKCQCCYSILRCVFSAVDEVVKHLHYNRNATPQEGLFFPCFCRGYSDPHAAHYNVKNQLGQCCGLFSKPEQVWIDKWIAGTNTCPLHVKNMSTITCCDTSVSSSLSFPAAAPGTTVTDEPTIPPDGAEDGEFTMA